VARASGARITQTGSPWQRDFQAPANVNSASIAPCGSPTIENRPVFGMDVVAEGVETAEQLSQLEALGCEFVQGFYFSRPVDVAAADSMIASQPYRESEVCRTTNCTV
jgi:hypothetical protein